MPLSRLLLVVLLLLGGTTVAVAAYVESRRPLPRGPVARQAVEKPVEDPGDDGDRRELTRSPRVDEESGDRQPGWAGA